MSRVATLLESSPANAESTAAAVRGAAGHSSEIIQQLTSAREVTWESPAAWGFRQMVHVLMAETALNHQDACSVADDLQEAAREMREWAVMARALTTALEGAVLDELPDIPLVERARTVLEEPGAFVQFVFDGGAASALRLLT